MLMTNFLKDRKSIREFKNKKVSMDIINQIEKYLHVLEKEYFESDFKLRLYDFGERIYNELKEIGGYSGVMVEAPNYIGLDVQNKKDIELIYGSYYMEKLITKLNSLGLNTCWISLDKIDKDIKVKIFGEHIVEMDYIIALGYGKAKTLFVPEITSERIGVDQIVFKDEIENPIDPDELENRGLSGLFYYVRFAPSSFNQQPWRFLLENDKVTLLLRYDKGKSPDIINAGIIMYYFEALAETIGISNKWTLVNYDYKGNESNYRYIAEIIL